MPKFVHALAKLSQCWFDILFFKIAEGPVTKYQIVVLFGSEVSQIYVKEVTEILELFCLLALKPSLLLRIANV
jgi:hypothetical protein